MKKILMMLLLAAVCVNTAKAEARPAFDIQIGANVAKTTHGQPITDYALSAGMSAGYIFDNDVKVSLGVERSAGIIVSTLNGGMIFKDGLHDLSFSIGGASEANNHNGIVASVIGLEYKVKLNTAAGGYIKLQAMRSPYGGFNVLGAGINYAV